MSPLITSGDGPETGAPDIVDGVATLNSASRDWLLSIVVPTIELRDALITDAVHTIRAVTETPIVAVRLIAVVDAAEKPTLTMHIRSRTAISGEQAEAVTSETLRRYASRLDLSGVTVTATGRPSPDEPTMR